MNIDRILTIAFICFTASLSSCGYRTFYPQRLNVYAFDSSGQTKCLIEPYFNLAGGQIGVSHSLSNHLFFAVNGQVNSFPLAFFSSDSANGTSTAFSGNAGLGYYGYKNSNGFEILPAFSYEKNQIASRYYEPYESDPYESDSHFRYLIPSLQLSYYSNGEKSNVYVTCRTSLLIIKHTYDDGPQSKPTVYSEDVLIEPGIEIMSKKRPWAQYAFSIHVPVHEIENFSYFPVFQLSVKFMIDADGDY